jgi:competence protein ComEC
MLARSICSIFLISLLARTTFAAAPAGPTLHIYFIDVEGGQSTLIVTPDKHSLLIDTGWAGDGSGFRAGDPHRARDANRIVAAAHDAGVGEIDYLLITHFHTDHVGGVSELAQLMPIRVFIDHGGPSEEAEKTSAETRRAFAAYAKVRSAATRHIEPKPGDRLPLNDVEATVVSSAATTLTTPLPGAGEKNPLCRDRASPPRDPYENPRSTGLVVRYGRFRFLDLGDLSGQPLFNLACPRNLVGPVDVYLVAHHGGPDVADRATFEAFRPRVAIMNNGLHKGGARATYQLLHQLPGLEDIWQLHWSAEAGDANFTAPYIANLDESSAHWIELVAKQDGSFLIFNQRTDERKEYAPRQGRSDPPAASLGGNR